MQCSEGLLFYKEDNRQWCFTLEELEDSPAVNPHTGNEFPQQFYNKIMELVNNKKVFRTLKSAIFNIDDDTPPTVKWDFIINAWLVYIGARQAFLFETANIPNVKYHADYLAVIDDIILPKVHKVNEPDSQPLRVLYYNNTPTVEKLLLDWNDDNLSMVLDFGCIDPEYGNTTITRYSYDLVVSAKDIPETEVISFVCTEQTIPDKYRLNSIVKPIQKAMNTYFNDGEAKIRVKKVPGQNELVDIFEEYISGKNNIAETEQYRKDILSSLLLEIYPRTLEIFDDPNNYTEKIRKWKLAIWAILLFAINEPYQSLWPLTVEQANDVEMHVANIEKRLYI